jgi:hypothetical protein
MGLLDRLKRAVSDLGSNPPDPNPEIGGVPARGRVARIGNHYISGGDTSLNRRDGRWVMEAQHARWNTSPIGSRSNPPRRRGRQGNPERRTSHTVPDGWVARGTRAS